MDLHIDDAQLGSCVACGLCLPHCPTFRITGDEAQSPRGRIAIMRQVQWQGVEPDDAFLNAIDTCVQCRGCETACPSGVPFGRLMEATRETLVAERRGYQPWWRRAGYRALEHHRLVLAGSTLLALGQRLRIVPSKRLGLSRLPLRRPRRRDSTGTGTGTPVWLYTGCVMDAWQRDVHIATQRVLEAAGASVRFASSSCCGALAHHAGLDIKALAAATIRELDGDVPVLVNSAGCGAQLKEYGHVLGTAEAAAFSARVFDVHEWLAPRADSLPLAQSGKTVAVQDPCHLRHVQKAHLPVRTLLSRIATVVELDDEGLCCGAGGAYSVLQHDSAVEIRRRKLAAIERSRAPLVASANPGCSMHLAAAGVATVHPMTLLAEALR